MASRQLYVIAATLLILPSYSARVFTVEWTTDGVDAYSSGGLQVKLGDVVTFHCINGSFSNIIYQPDQAQFDACNTTVSSGAPVRFAECRGSERDVNLTINSRSATLGSAIPIMAGEQVFFTSYSTGTAMSATTSLTMGGECLMGLKLAISIADNDPTVSTTPDSQGGSPGNQGGSPGGNTTNTEGFKPAESKSKIGIIVGSVVGGTVVVIGLVCLNFLCIRWKKKQRERKIKPLPENGDVVIARTGSFAINGSLSESAPNAKVVGNGDDSAPVSKDHKPVSPVTSSLGPQTSRGGQKPVKSGTTQSNTQNQRTATVTDKKSSAAQKRPTNSSIPLRPVRRIAPLLPPNSQQKLPPQQRCRTDAGRQSKDCQQKPLSSLPVRLT